MIENENEGNIFCFSAPIPSTFTSDEHQKSFNRCQESSE